MLKVTEIALLIAAFVFVVVFIIGTAIMPSGYWTRHWNSIIGFLESHDKAVAGFSTIVLVAFTALLAVSTLLLFFATRSLVRGADDTAQRQLRAYVYLETVVTGWPPKAPNRYAIGLKMTNGGKTWARNLRILKLVVPKQQDNKGDPFDSLKWDETVNPTLLGPGQTVTLQFGELPVAEINEIADGKKGYDYVAWVKYEDTVSPKPIIRQTQLSQHMNGDHEGGISFSYRATHNCADDDCPG